MMNAEINAKLEGITLCSDPPEHTRMRNVLGRPVTCPSRSARS